MVLVVEDGESVDEAVAALLAAGFDYVEVVCKQ